MITVRRTALLLCLTSMMLTACDGESQPFEEAVEIRNLQITALSVTPPANSQDDIFLNTNDRVQFGIQALQANGESLELSGTGRQWFVNEESRANASIDSNGLLTARTDGSVSVFVRIGDLVSTAYTLMVQNASLEAIESIQGETLIERCLPKDYFALGTFSDNSTRNLNTVTWSIGDTADARVVTNPDATATLTGLNATNTLSLTATVGAITSAMPAAITVQDTLSALSISPSPARVDVDETQAFTATGLYNEQAATDTTPASGTSRVVITDSVDWSITSGASNATVNNVSPNKGRVTGISSDGVAVLSASCGDLATEQTIVVDSTTSSSTSDQLSFNTDSPLSISLSNRDGFQLRVSTGSTFDADNEITQVDDGVVWADSHTNSSTPIIVLLRTGINAGLIRPQAQGDGTATVTATFNNQTISIIISVVTP